MGELSKPILSIHFSGKPGRRNGHDIVHYLGPPVEWTLAIWPSGRMDNGVGEMDMLTGAHMWGRVRAEPPPLFFALISIKMIISTWDLFLDSHKKMFMNEPHWAFSGLRIIRGPPPPLVFAKIIYMKGLT